MTEQPLQIGSSLIPLYVERRMKVYLVTESEFASLSTLNAQTTTFVSIGLALISIAVSIWVNAVFYTEVPPAAAVAKVLVSPILLLVGLALFWLAWRASKSRTSTWNAIKTESASSGASATA